MINIFRKMVAKLGMTMNPKEEQKALLMVTKSKFVVQGDAKDQETIIRLRPWIEDEARKEYGEFARTELYWNLNHGNGLFDYEIHFFDAKL